MRWLKRLLVTILAILVFAFLHYTLPQRDVVRIVGTENRRIDFGENSFFWASPDVGTAASASRDVFFIQTIKSNGDPMVYRNEDTGWNWPPYFKMNSSNLQAKAVDLISRVDAPQWVVVTHYGWRNELFTIFPNAVGLRPVDGPNVSLIPWVNIIILTLLAALVFTLSRMWQQFRERMIDPAMDEAEIRSVRLRDRLRRLFRRG